MTHPAASAAAVKVRFCPSPTGTPHVGLIRTALFNWAFARQAGGSMLFRIEDTDAARDSQESYEQLIEALTWLGIDWDEGVERGGDAGPYRQSMRGEIYREILDKLIATGAVYECFSSPEEVEARHRAAGRDPKLGYDNYDRDLSEADKQAFREQGRKPVWRLRMPDEDLTFTDLVRADVTFAAGVVPDFVVARADGSPLYTFVNPVDDALMGVTHVIRGEDLLSSTPRQLALYSALIDAGVTATIPAFGHLPLVTGDGGKKLSKRDPRSDLFAYKRAGFIREGLLNYLALLGWSLSADEDIFTPDELVAHFDIGAVSSNAARFDDKKALAINAEHIRRLSHDDLTGRLVPYLHQAGLTRSELTETERSRLAAFVPLIDTRMQTLAEGVEMIRFAFLDEADFTVDDAARSSLRAEARDVLGAAKEVCDTVENFTTDTLSDALRDRLVEQLGIKPRHAFAPLRVAICGAKVSPPLFESMEILGRQVCCDRLAKLAESLPAQDTE